MSVVIVGRELTRAVSAPLARAAQRAGLVWAIPIAIALVTFVAFSPALENAFVEWDDHVLFVGNDAYRGLGWSQLTWMFSTVLMGHYSPITWLTLGLDYVIWGMHPAGYHLTNLLLHAAGAALFYLVALRLLGAATRWTPAVLRLAASAAALFFALHPLRAESVAWVTERRDVLSGVFFFVTLLLYLQAAPHTGRRRVALHAGALAAYTLAIFSKSIVMTLPAVLALIDVYPLRRLDPDWRRWTAAPAWTVWCEKVPYVALGVLAAMLGYYGQAANGILTSLADVAWWQRPSLVFFSVWFYISKTALPVALSPLYELPMRVDPLDGRFLVPTVAVIAITLALALGRRRWPAGLAVWTSYVILLAPVSGIAHAGHQLAHDRYTYLSGLGFALLVGAGVGALGRLRERRALARPVAHAGAVAIAAWFMALGLLGWQQAQVWRDTETLWRNAVEAQPDCALCGQNLGVALIKQNLPSVARPHLERALDLRPDYVKVHLNMGLVFAQLGDMPQAVEHFQKVLASRPDDGIIAMNLGVALMKQGRHPEAVGYLRRAVLLRPDDFLPLSNFGVALTETGSPDAAVRMFQRAIELRPDAAESRYGLMRAYLALDDHAGAVTAHRALADLDPQLAAFMGPALLTSW